MKAPLLDPTLLAQDAPLSVRIAELHGTAALEFMRKLVDAVNDTDAQEAPEMYAELKDLYYAAASLCALALQ